MTWGGDISDHNIQVQACEGSLSTDDDDADSDVSP